MGDNGPGLEMERGFAHHGSVAGLDEAGRGAWAGPVAAGAVILPLERSDLTEVLDGVRDSKRCSAAERDRLHNIVLDVAAASAVGLATAAEVDELGVVPATRLAMRRALDELSIDARALIIDGGTLFLPTINLPQESRVRGDNYSLSIAAASILAKVTRDRMLVGAAETYPEYGFERHKGYGTPQHRAALKKHGPCDIHRYSFSPIRTGLFDPLASDI